MASQFGKKHWWRVSDDKSNPGYDSNRCYSGIDSAYICCCAADGGGVTDLLLIPPITLSVVNHCVGKETMLQQSTCEGRLNAVESIVGRDKWFLISMPDLILKGIFIF